MTVALAKEVRAQLPTFAAAALAVASAAAVPGDPLLLRVALLGLVFGSVILGAQAIGHEYTYRTLPLLLAQPADRRRILALKAAVLGVLLLVLAAGAFAALSPGPYRVGRQGVGAVPLLLIVLGSLSVAPALTMMTRSPLAGSVFTLAIPGMLYLGLELVGIGIHGTAAIQRVEDFREAVWWPLMFALCGASLAATVPMFMRLQLADGRGTDISLPASWAQRQADVAPRKTHAVWSLFRKELRLQQMTLVVAALYAIGAAGLSMLGRTMPEIQDVTRPLTLLYVGLLSVLIGALSSAEERHLGTLQWQLLLPMPAWKQWGIKTATAIGLAVLLAGALPMAVGVLTGQQVVPRYDSRDKQHLLRILPQMLLIVVVLTTAAIYVSSLSTSGIRALVTTVPVFALVVVGEGWLERSPLPRWVHDVATPLRSAAPGLRQQIVAGLMVLLPLALLAVLLTLAFRNHRALSVGAGRIARQAAGIAAYLLVALLLIIAFA
jgi:hypothetical protein